MIPLQPPDESMKNESGRTDEESNDSSSYTPNSSDKPEEACGVFGIYAPEEDVAKLTYFGLYALQHRGQESAGIATFDGEQVHLHKEMGLVSQVFNESILQQMPGSLAVGHTRYSTTGSSRVVNAQPAVLETRLGTLALTHNGNLVNTGHLREELLQRQCNLITTTDSELIAFAIAEEINAGKDWLPASISALEAKKSARDAELHADRAALEFARLNTLLDGAEIDARSMKFIRSLFTNAAAGGPEEETR